jgi:hypothetical protein
MKRAPSFCCVLVLHVQLLYGCTAPPYLVVNEKSFARASNAPDMKKLIWISDDQVPNNEQLIFLLNKRKWLEFDEKLKLVQDADTRNFLQSIRLLLQEKYLPSFYLLNSMPETAFDCQALMLKTDCLHELRADSVNYHSQYQKAVDCTQHQQIKSIAKTRYRFFNYGY